MMESREIRPTTRKGRGIADHPERVIHAAILFADLDNSVMLSSTLPNTQYMELLKEFQKVMGKVAMYFRSDLAIALGYEDPMMCGEITIRGDQLALFFYDPTEVRKNIVLRQNKHSEDPRGMAAFADAAKWCKARHQLLVWRMVECAMRLKEDWICSRINQTRIDERQEPYSLSIGISHGRVYYDKMPDNQHRIEGHSISYAKRIEGHSRRGKYTKILLSRRAHDRLVTRLDGRFRAGQFYCFVPYTLEAELLKGIPESADVFELKYQVRGGYELRSSTRANVYAELYGQNRSYIWLYYRLFEHYYHRGRSSGLAGRTNWRDSPNVKRALELAKRAFEHYPDDEKVMIDLAYYHMDIMKDYDIALALVNRAIECNKEFEFPYRVKARIIAKQQAMFAASNPSETNELQRFLDDRIDCLFSSLGLCMDAPITHVMLSYCYAEKAKLSEGKSAAKARKTAIGHLEYALSLNPEASYFKHRLSYRQADRLIRSGRLDDHFAALLRTKLLDQSKFTD